VLRVTSPVVLVRFIRFGKVEWRPDPGWGLPELPGGWDVV